MIQVKGTITMTNKEQMMNSKGDITWCTHRRILTAQKIMMSEVTMLNEKIFQNNFHTTVTMQARMPKKLIFKITNNK